MCSGICSGLVLTIRDLEEPSLRAVDVYCHILFPLMCDMPT